MVRPWGGGTIQHERRPVPRRKNGRRALVPALLLVLAATSLACKPPPAAPAAAPPAWAKYVGPVRVLGTNAGWCWWQSERAVISGNTLVVGSVPNRKGPGGTTRVTQALTLDLVTGQTRTGTLGTNPYRDDDHDSPGLAVDPNGGVTAAYTGHGDDGVLRFRRSTAPGTGQWSALPDLEAPVQRAPNQVTYANLVRAEGKLWNLTRRDNRTWITWSEDDGVTWDGAWLLFEGTWAGGGNPDLAVHRPYLHVVANPVLDRIDFVTTAGHPLEMRSTALYSGYIKDGNVHRTDGTVVGPLGPGPGYRPVDLTLVARPSDPIGSGPYQDADLWGSDLVIDPEGRPVIAYSERTPAPSTVPGRQFAQLYHWARWDGTAWRTSRVGSAGSELYASEKSYTGLVDVDPSDPYRLVLSTNAHPVTAAPLTSRSDGKVHWELFEAYSADRGATWSFRPLTQDSTADNIRPLIATDAQGRWAVAWLEGTYRSWVDWDMRALVMTAPTAAGPRPPTIDPTPPPPPRR